MFTCPNCKTDYYEPADTANYIGVHPVTVVNYRRDGDLPKGHKVGITHLYTKEQLDEGMKNIALRASNKTVKGENSD